MTELIKKKKMKARNFKENITYWQEKSQEANTPKNKDANKIEQLLQKPYNFRFFVVVSLYYLTSKIRTDNCCRFLLF